jgi:NAD(P)-dependent dehydrogenase (short-subunit alcohol dehydrogenase family)
VTTEFAGRTALVTGAGRGIGQAIALELAAGGASLIMIARSASQLAETRAMALAQGALPGQIHVVSADLGDPEQRAAAAAAALAAAHADILINNAAAVEPLGRTAAIRPPSCARPSRLTSSPRPRSPLRCCPACWTLAVAASSTCPAPSSAAPPA